MDTTKTTFSIKEAAEMSGLTEDTIRYYEKIGILPPPERRANTHRVYNMERIDTMKLITCLKKTGLSLEAMKPFLHFAHFDEMSAYPELRSLMTEHKLNIEQQIASLQQVVNFIDQKLLAGGAVADDAQCALAAPEKRPPASGVSGVHAASRTT